jgi:uncharacterized membrane protein YkoI
MKRALFPALAAAAATFAVSATAATPAHLTGEALAGKAKVDLPQARAIALKARPGKIVDEELEKEGGGSGLRYSFDVKSAGKTYEVGVDAVTGRVLENGGESAAREAAEAKTEGPEHEKGAVSPAHQVQK